MDMRIQSGAIRKHEKNFAVLLREKEIDGLTAVRAQRFLGEIYYDGRGIEKNIALSQRYLEAVLQTEGTDAGSVDVALRLLQQISQHKRPKKSAAKSASAVPAESVVAPSAALPGMNEVLSAASIKPIPAAMSLTSAQPSSASLSKSCTMQDSLPSLDYAIKLLYSDKKYVQAKKAFMLILKKGSPQLRMTACRYLGYIYYYGLGVQKDPRQAMIFWDVVIQPSAKGVAAEIDRALCFKGMGRGCLLVVKLMQSLEKNILNQHLVFLSLFIKLQKLPLKTNI